MDWKLFAGTFWLIFLAELGDKTQLTAMMQATSGLNARWTVFFAASAALVCSTFAAVMVGGVLTKYVPPHYIKGIAGIVFLVFGVLVLREALTAGKPEEKAAPAAVAEPTGFLARFAFEMAANFEAAAEASYMKLAEETEDEPTKKVFLALAADEREHLARMRSLKSGEEEKEIEGKAPLETIWEEIKSTGVSAEPKDRTALAEVLEHEKLKANFYAELARRMHVPSLQQAFDALAAEERGHAEKISELMKA